MFQQSSLTYLQAKQKVARAASTEADGDMLTKAGDAIDGAIQLWNNRRHWNFLRTNASFATVAPFNVGNVTTTSESTAISAPSLSDVLEGDIVSGTGIRPETTIVSVTAGVPDTAVLSHPASAGGTVTLTFARRDYAVPANFKHIYNMRNLATGRILIPTYSRHYDSMNGMQINADEPVAYDLHRMGDVGKIRFLPTPFARYMLLAKVYRRMSVPSSDGALLDIPIDFEWGILSEAKSIFLFEKGGYENSAAFWAGKAREAFAAAALTDSKHPDKVFAFLPGYLRPSSLGGGGGTASGGVGVDGYGWGETWGEEWGSP